MSLPRRTWLQGLAASGLALATAACDRVVMLEACDVE